jgi:asparagine synthase (glutamine-hydrolysing)
MCGFSGFYDGNASFLSNEDYFKSILNDMTSVLLHRGPDGNGIVLSAHCGFSHTRLSIIDPLRASQPFCYNQYTLVYNGELYNTAALRNDLKLLNCQFRTTSDTEVILYGLIHFGPDFLKQLDGIFSLAFYDEYKNTLILARDCFGVKPLFYTLCNGTLIFSSEIKGLLSYPDVKAVVKKEGLQELFGLGPARNQGNAIFDNIREVLPGTFLQFTPKDCRSVTYWKLQSHEHTDDYETTVQKTRELLVNAIQKQMVSDVPICTFLSGGVDSSVVSAVCADTYRQINEVLTTFSFDFTDNDIYFKANKFQPSQDRPYVDKMVAYINSDHHYLECDNSIQAKLLYDSVIAHDLPCMADVDSSLLYFCSEVAKTHKVVLTGECADEIFGGYPWFHRAEFFVEGQFPWTPDLTPRLDILQKELRQELDLNNYVKESCLSASLEIDVLPQENETEKLRRKISYLNIRYFMQTLLNRMDRTSMNSSLEARVPLCDRSLVEYVFNVPWEMKAKNGVVKNLLREAARGLLPDDILFRPKSPYPKTYHPSYEAILKAQMRECLLDCSSPLLNLVDKDYLMKFVDAEKDYGKPWYGQLMAGPQMLAYLLQIDFWLRHYKISLQ